MAKERKKKERERKWKKERRKRKGKGKQMERERKINCTNYKGKQIRKKGVVSIDMLAYSFTYVANYSVKFTRQKSKGHETERNRGRTRKER